MSTFLLGFVSFRFVCQGNGIASPRCNLLEEFIKLFELYRTSSNLPSWKLRKLPKNLFEPFCMTSCKSDEGPCMSPITGSFPGRAPHASSTWMMTQSEIDFFSDFLTIKVLKNLSSDGFLKLSAEMGFDCHYTLKALVHGVFDGFDKHYWSWRDPYHIFLKLSMSFLEPFTHFSRWILMSPTKDFFCNFEFGFSTPGGRAVAFSLWVTWIGGEATTSDYSLLST